MDNIALHRICIVLLLSGLVWLGVSHYNEVQQHTKDVTELNNVSNEFMVYKDSTTGILAIQTQHEVSETVAKVEAKKVGMRKVTAIVSASVETKATNVNGKVVHDTVFQKPMLRLTAIDRYFRLYARVIDTLFIVDSLKTYAKPKFVFGELSPKGLFSFLKRPDVVVGYYDENKDATVIGMSNVVVPYNPKWHQRKWIVYVAGIATAIIILKIDPG